MEMVAEMAPTLGASSFSQARARAMAVVLAALASSVSFTADPAMVQALLAEPLVVPTIDAPEIASDGRADAITPEMRRLLARIIAAIEQEPVEDGVSHPAEPWLARFLQQYSATALYSETFEGRHGAVRAASLLRLLGRQKPENPGVREKILRAALASSSIEVRDAAVQAVELWEDRTAIEVLRSHVEQTRWLADYINRVLQQIA
jgi:hypothetical protein